MDSLFAVKKNTFFWERYAMLLFLVLLYFITKNDNYGNR